jgi:hypothetical protein
VDPGLDATTATVAPAGVTLSQLKGPVRQVPSSRRVACSQVVTKEQVSAQESMVEAARLTGLGFVATMNTTPLAAVLYSRPSGNCGRAGALGTDEAAETAELAFAELAMETFEAEAAAEAAAEETLDADADAAMEEILEADGATEELFGATDDCFEELATAPLRSYALSRVWPKHSATVTDLRFLVARKLMMPVVISSTVTA